MTNTIKFTKMHGAGNDYIYVDTTRYPIADPEKKAIAWSRFHTGIGSDGLILIGTSDKGDFSMRIFNADGSEAMMCGNGSRCVGKYVYEYGLTDKTEITLDTLSGIKILKLHINGKAVSAVTVDMGVHWKQVKSVLEKNILSGLPKYQWEILIWLLFVEDISQIDLPKIGPELEKYHLFPDRTNVEFAQVIGKDTIRMRVWERGSGITQACGTGACATAVAACINGLAGRKSDIIMDGGTVTIEWEEASGHILMTGPATKVFDGEIEADNGQPK